MMVKGLPSEPDLEIMPRYLAWLILVSLGRVQGRKEKAFLAG